MQVSAGNLDDVVHKARARQYHLSCQGRAPSWASRSIIEGSWKQRLHMQSLPDAPADVGVALGGPVKLKLIH